jgi:hypothetical protein
MLTFRIEQVGRKIGLLYKHYKEYEEKANELAISMV